ncbi:transposase [Nonomuraea sp. NPDC052265]|uniref:transposase n=1 Tax=Nonomuraea sp. NPDC052265 TaxID=3364374 RepID=UPI0037C7A63F
MQWISFGTAQPARLAEAGVPQGSVFATKPELAWKMIERAADDVLLSFGWVTGDEAYGDNAVLRARCRGRGLNQVFAVSCDHPIRVAGADRRTPPAGHTPHPRQRHSHPRAGTGNKAHPAAL